jgi:hypothetical protein
MTLATDQQYEVSAWKGDHRSELLRRPWESLASSRETSTAVYQSPLYFDFLHDGNPDDLFVVLTVKDKRTDAIAGIVPVKLWTYRLRFTFRARTFFEIGRSSVGILGSEPMIPDDPRAFDELFAAFARQYPESQVIYMDAVPPTSYLWRHLQTSATIRSLYYTLVMDGFREWHYLLLPKSMDEYYKRLTRKKRYNLMRQERRLQAHGGYALRLVIINKEEDIHHLSAAMESCLPKKKHDFFFRKEEYIRLSRFGLLHCYILHSGEDIVGLLLGTKAGKIFRISRLFHNHSMKKFSPGTTLWQLVLKDLISGGEFSRVDFGYGLPAYRHSSTNVVEQRGRVLLFRRTAANRCLVLAYSFYSTLVRFVADKVKRISRQSVAPGG